MCLSCVGSTITFKTCYVLWFCCNSVPKFSLSTSYGAFLMGPQVCHVGRLL